MRKTTTQVRFHEFLQQHRGDRAHLCQGVGLAEDAGLELPPAYGRVKYRRHQQNPYVPAENQNRDHGWNQFLVHQHQKNRAQQKFVGHRIKILAQHGALFKHPRQQAIERVGQSRGDKQAEAESKLALENGVHQKWREANTRQRKQIGSGAKRIKSWARIVRASRIQEAR